MALFLFTKAILEGRPIDVFNHGDMQRDFTYIDDIVESLVRVLDRPAIPDPGYLPEQPDPATSSAPYRIFNIGNHQPVPLLEFIRCIEIALGKSAEKRLLPMQDGDVAATYADASALRGWVDGSPGTPVEVGVARFVAWYRSYYGR
jgi:UDP-glucuronate 4-epimerase